MKRIIGTVALLCVIAVLASCGLPDPAQAVDMYFKDLSNSEGYLARELKEDESFKEFVEQYPGTEKAVTDFITAYLGTFEYEIHKNRTEVDNQAGMARVYVTYTCADINEISEEVMDSNEYLEFIAELSYTDWEELIIFMFELMTEKIDSGNWDPMTVDATVELQYDSALRAWIITNEDEIFSAIG